MKKQFLSLIVALFVTSTFVLANNGQPVTDAPSSSDVVEFVSPAKLGMIVIQGVALEESGDDIICKVVDNSNQTCAQILQKGEGESIIYINGSDGTPISKVQVQSYNLRQVFKKGELYTILDYVPFTSTYQSSSSLKTLSVQ